MKSLAGDQKYHAGLFITGAATLLLLVACAAKPVTSEGAMELRNKLTELNNDSELSSRARVELREAEQAVQLAEKPLPDEEDALASHRIYMADHQIEIARARATARLAEDQRAQLGEQRSEARLQARTREADKARADAARARQSEAEMQRRLEDLEARKTERGMVVTLGDVLFDTGSAQLRSSATSNLEKLVDFLKRYPAPQVLIEGHTDNVGSVEFNQRLSLQRAESVKNYLTRRGAASGRLSVSGAGMQHAIASNDTAAGRQQNRRVEVVIKSPAGDQ